MQKKLMYKGNYEKDRVEKYREFNEQYKSTYHNVVVGNMIRFTIPHYAIDIDKEGKGYMIVDLNKVKEYWDMSSKQVMQINDYKAFSDFLEQYGFFVLEDRKPTNQIVKEPQF